VKAERRHNARESTLVRGRICYGGDYALWADCLIRDLSDGGAKLQVSAVHPLPDSFVVLQLVEGVAMVARLKWRRGDMAGVACPTRYDLRGMVPGDLAPVRKLWLALSR
jgi:hypothetical protein